MTDDLSQPITLLPSRKKLVAFLVLSAVFVVTAVFMIRAGDGQSAKGWFGLIFFGLGGVVFVAMLLPGSTYLRLEPRGFTTCTLFRRQFYPWSAVRQFGVTRLVVHQVVGINFEPGSDFAGKLGRVNTRLAGYEGALPDTYGMSAEALASLMNRALSNSQSRSR